MEQILRKHFPMMRDRKEVLTEIESKEELSVVFNSWSESQQNIFLDFCTGVRGLKLLRDGFFKEIMNPEIHKERLNDFLSCMLGQKVSVLKVLPTDSGRIADESSLVIMDIVVELEDGSIANVEMQRVGYLFPGQRSACYSADLLLRQYKRVRSEKGKHFNYRDIKNVYTIVLYEKSPKKFYEFQDCYFHSFEQKSNTGLEMELLQKYLFIPLDIFLKNPHNIDNKRDAWLLLLAEDNPEQVVALIEKYPEFRGIYEDAYAICCNVEEVMRMFSKELYELDKNTVQYMIDEMQDTIDAQQDTIDTQQGTIESQRELIEKSIVKMVEMMKKLNCPDEEIEISMQEQFGLSKEQIEIYMKSSI